MKPVTSFVDGKRYFAVSCPSDWEASELADMVGLLVQSPQAPEGWRARVRINVRVCPASQTLDKTLAIVHADMLKVPGVQFVGRSRGDHSCGSSAGILRWAAAQSRSALAVEQLFIAVAPGLVVQLTSSAPVAALARYDAAFEVIFESIRVLPALVARAAELAQEASGTQQVEHNLVDKAPSSKKPPHTQPAARVDAEPQDDNSPGSSRPRGGLRAARGGRGAEKQPVPQNPPVPAKEDAQESIPQSISLNGPGDTAGWMDKAFPTKSAGSGESAVVPVEGPEAFAGIWSVLEITSKLFVSEMGKVARRLKFKPNYRSIFEARVYMCYSLVCVVDAHAEMLGRPGQELRQYIEQKISARSRARQQVYERRMQAFSHARKAAQSDNLRHTHLGQLALHFIGSALDHETAIVSGRQQEFLATLADLELRLVNRYCQRLSELFTSQPQNWSQVSTEEAEAALGRRRQFDSPSENRASA